jgi:hypothetical protein
MSINIKNQQERILTYENKMSHHYLKSVTYENFILSLIFVINSLKTNCIVSTCEINEHKKNRIKLFFDSK